jgi:hypothetical protein
VVGLRAIGVLALEIARAGGTALGSNTLLPLVEGLAQFVDDTDTQVLDPRRINSVDCRSRCSSLHGLVPRHEPEPTMPPVVLLQHPRRAHHGRARLVRALRLRRLPRPAGRASNIRRAHTARGLSRAGQPRPQLHRCRGLARGERVSSRADPAPADRPRNAAHHRHAGGPPRRLHLHQGGTAAAATDLVHIVIAGY